ncbi:MSL3 family protein [Megaselia abdita]
MVSTRCPKQKFTEGEKVLCYEPDQSKAKVLYDSKVLGIYEARDKRGRKTLQYKIHFQGWNSSWDRKVSQDYILKDTKENRQLQKELAEKAQLQLAAYLYRKERKRQRLPGRASGDQEPSTEENSRSSGIEQNKMEFATKENGDCESESYSSSVESGTHEEDRVLLRVSEKLKNFLEYDHEMIVKNNRQHILPAKVTAVQILENFVKQSAIKLVFSNQTDSHPRRRVHSARNDKREKDFEKVITIINLLKEVADGIRIYFDFTITNHLLYKEEKAHAAVFMQEENWKHFSYVPSVGLSPEFLLSKSETECMDTTEEPTTTNTEKAPLSGGEESQSQKRRLRSHKGDEDAKTDGPENLISKTPLLGSPRSGKTTPPPPPPPQKDVAKDPTINTTSAFLKSLPSINMNIPQHIKEYLQKILSWQILPTKAEPEASMIFGATHLARLIGEFSLSFSKKLTFKL